METLSLNENWTVEYFEPDIDGFEMAPAPEPVRYLPMWRCSARFAKAGFYAYLRRLFGIDMSDGVCVRYLLHIKHAPGTTRIYVNDRQVGQAHGELTEIDITDFVWLGENKLNLRLDCWHDGQARFGDVVLLQVPCEEL